MGRIMPYMKWTIKAMLETTNQLFNSIITSSFGDFSSVWWMNHDESHTGWWYTYPEKYDRLSWAYDIHLMYFQHHLTPFKIPSNII
jgi:hypothetical protein